MNAHNQPGQWIGRSLLRKEDNRHLLGASTFVGDIRLPTPALTEWPGVSAP
ncbi:CO/xanthine dehydrogenase Mo-binding subunit [Nitrobacteraceae bacterium AZCC 2161]